jgi:hypothetical protein
MAGLGIRSTFAAAGDAVADLMDRVTDWDTPALGSWNVASLCGHLVLCARNTAGYAHGAAGEGPLIPSAAAYYRVYLEQRASDPEGVDAAVAERARSEVADDLPGKFRVAQAAALAAIDWAGPGLVIAARYGSIHLSDYLRTRTLELVTHGVDLARAIGVRDWSPPPEALIDAISLLGEVAADTGRGIELVMLLTGRDDPTNSPVLPVLC